MRSIGNTPIDTEGAESVLRAAFFESPFADVLDPRPPAIDRAERDGFKPLLRLSQSPISEVWRCVDLASKMDVVIKLIREDTVPSSKNAEDLLRHEARVLGSLRGIDVTLPLRQVSEGWSSYLAIPYVNGDPITTHCRTRDLGVKERLRLFARCVDRIARIHERGVVHGDLKPEHLLIDLDASSSPVVIDFGLATLSDRTSHAVSGEFNIGGTKDYMAPELTPKLNEPGWRPDPNQDVFSLGQVLKRLMKDVEPGTARQGIEAIVLKATAPAPADRYENARAMHEAMARVLNLRDPIDKSTQADKKETTSPLGFQWKQPLIASALAGIITVGAVSFAMMPNQIGGVTNPETEKNESEDAGETLTASFLTDLVARAEDEPEAVLYEIDQLSEEDQGMWEVGHAQALALGLGSDKPFGDLPYVEVHAPAYAYHPETNTLIWCDVHNQIYLRRGDAEVMRLWQSQVIPQQIQIRPDGMEVLIRDMAGAVNLVALDKVSFGEARELQRIEPTPQLASYSHSGGEVMIWRNTIHMFEVWDAGDLSNRLHSRHLPGADFNQYLISDGYWGSCHKVETPEGPRTRMDLYDYTGDVICKVDFPISGWARSFDYRPRGGVLCVGTSNGHVITFDLDARDRRTIYLGYSGNVTSVLVVPSEQKIFAALGLIHAIDMDSYQITVKLGDPEERTGGFIRLSWSPADRAVTAFWPIMIHRWCAEPVLD